MALRVGILSTAHMHIYGYAAGFRNHPRTELVGLWDDNAERANDFSAKSGVPFFADLNELLGLVDAVVITSENNRHAEMIEWAAAAGKHVLCEKPLVAKAEDVARVEKAVADSGITLMTAFPCRFSPAFQRLKQRVKAGEIGKVLAISATNRGRCPFGWFVEPDLSGGGAMIDHVVHVTDLLRDLLGEEPTRVQAQIGNNMYGKEWDDTAMLTLEFPSGIFATLDSSWSRPGSFKTWGDVTMTVVGESGTVELDMFGQGLDVYGNGTPSLNQYGYGADLDALMVAGFVEAIESRTQPPVTMFDGLQAARVSLAGYQSVKTGQPVAVATV